MSIFVPQKAHKEVISIRISSELLQKVDAAANEADISRNAFINQSIEFALEQMTPKEK